MWKAFGSSPIHVLASICTILTFALTYLIVSGDTSDREPGPPAPGGDSAIVEPPAPNNSGGPGPTPVVDPPPPPPIPVAPAPGTPAVTGFRTPVEQAPAAARDLEVEAFLRNVTPANRSGVATALRGSSGSDAADLVVAGIGDLGVPLLHGVFHRGFLSTPQFDQLNGGDGRLLHRAGVLGPGALALVGSVRHTFQKGEYGLVTCDLSFSYTVFDAGGSARSTRTFAVRIPAYDERTALRDAVAALLSNHAAAIQADLH